MSLPQPCPGTKDQAMITWPNQTSLQGNLKSPESKEKT